MKKTSPSSLFTDNEDEAAVEYQRARAAHWDVVVRGRTAHRTWGGAYHWRLAEVYRFLIPPSQRVLEIGCGDGDLLAALQPGRGVGINFSPEMIRRAVARHPSVALKAGPALEFIQADAHDLNTLEGSFDAIIPSNTINDLWDVQAVFQQIARLSAPQTRIILNFYSRLWELPLKAAQVLGLAMSVLPQNWLTAADVRNLLNLAGFEVIRSWQEVLWPLPLLGAFFNRFLARLWPFHQLALAE